MSLDSIKSIVSELQRDLHLPDGHALRGKVSHAEFERSLAPVLERMSTDEQAEAIEYLRGLGDVFLPDVSGRAREAVLAAAAPGMGIDAPVMVHAGVNIRNIGGLGTSIPGLENNIRQIMRNVYEPNQLRVSYANDYTNVLARAMKGHGGEARKADAERIVFAFRGIGA